MIKACETGRTNGDTDERDQTGPNAGYERAIDWQEGG